MIKLLILFLLGGLTGVAGRMGGSGNYPRQVRVIGIPILLSVILWFLGIHNLIALFIFCGLSIGAISTYYDTIFGYDNFWVHGFMLGLASLPITILVTHNYGFLVARCLLLAVYMGVLHIYQTNAVKEEFLRYFILPISMWLI